MPSIRFNNTNRGTMLKARRLPETEAPSVTATDVELDGWQVVLATKQ